MVPTYMNCVCENVKKARPRIQITNKMLARLWSMCRCLGFGSFEMLVIICRLSFRFYPDQLDPEILENAALNANVALSVAGGPILRISPGQR